MENWAKEIMTLANDFCINTSSVRQIVANVDALTVPQGKVESEWKYDRAYSRIKTLLMKV